MDLSLPALPQASRSGTPQDFDVTSSNCQNLRSTAMEIKWLAPGIEQVHSQISNLITQGLSDPNDRAIVEKSQLLERLNGYYQQVGHEANDKDCKKYQEEIEILKIKVQQQISGNETVEKFQREKKYHTRPKPKMIREDRNS
ncbi:hypothetical protein TNCV_3444521 [Trichonephila clavipes]|nr:hypothetical protein TNCV_3444521 [Trichonephila clavipes]